MATSSNAKSQAIAAKKVTTQEFRVSFPSVFEPKSFNGGPEKFSITMLFPKNADLSAMKKAANAALVEKWGADKTKWPKKMKTPFRDGDEDRGDQVGYEGMIFVMASGKNRPGLVDRQLHPITSEEDFYAGCYARATLIAFAYDTSGNRGVSFSLQNIQKIRDGEKFGGRRKAEDEFEVINDGSDDASNYESDSEDDDDLGI